MGLLQEFSSRERQVIHSARKNKFIRKLKVHRLSSMAGGKKTTFDFCYIFDSVVNDMLVMVCIWMTLVFTNGSELIKMEDRY